MNINAKQEDLSSLNRVTQSESMPSGGAKLGVKVTYYLLLVYAFLSPLGSLAQIGDEERLIRFTTLVLILTLTINLLKSVVIIRTNKLLISLILLVLWIGFSSLFSSEILAAYIKLAILVLYILFSSLVFSIDWSVKKIYRLFSCFIIGGFFCATLTLIDWFRLVDIPKVNKLMRYSGTELGNVLQASGPFDSRSAMAAYFSLLIPISMLAFLYIKKLSIAFKMLAFITAITSTIVLFLTHNRAGILGTFLAIVVISIFTSYSIRKLLRVLVMGVVLVTLFYWLFTTYFSEQLIVYKAKLNIGEIASTDASLQESDNLRIILFNHVIRSLTVNPVGNGYTPLTGLSGYDEIDPHNNITQIIWAAGIFGIGWLVYFGVSIFNSTKVILSKKYSNNPFNQYGVVIVGSLLGWFFCGMAHTNIGTGMAWLLFGVLLKIIKVNSQESKSQS